MSKKILFVDDDANLIEVLRIRFESLGYVVVAANNGEGALLKMRAEKPDLVVMDVSMPKMDGHELVQEMKADDVLKSIPVVVLSGKEKMQDLFEMEGVGAYLTKPFDCKELLTKVEQLLKEE